MDKVKILVVDDESRMRKLVKDFLARAHFEVLEAADGEEALDLFYQDKEIALIYRKAVQPQNFGCPRRGDPAQGKPGGGAGYRGGRRHRHGQSGSLGDSGRRARGA